MARGIHHITAISGPAARNRAFHERLLGQRLVKRTVNFDDPGTYHLYYGDESGTPGSILTFFPWDHVAPGRVGAGETSETAFQVPKASLTGWTRRFAAAGVPFEPLLQRFGEPVLVFQDPDGMPLALVGIDGLEAASAWTPEGHEAAAAIRGFHGITITVADPVPTAAVLTNVLGFHEIAREGAITRYATPEAGMGGTVDLKAAPELPRGRQGGGSVHHVAFRAVDDADQAAMVETLRRDHGLSTTEQKDRSYFRSVYLREPGGTIFEIATDIPGFAVDEATSELGQALKLPSFLEPQRRKIEAALPAL